MLRNELSRRSFLATAAAGSLGVAALAKGKKIPVGLELYSVRDQLSKDLEGTVTAVAKQGYDVVEFYSPYMEWTPDRAKQVRKLLDDLKIKCLSTHNGPKSFTDDLQKAIELNSILGAKYIVLASAGRVGEGLDGWKKVAETLSTAQEKMKSAKLKAGYHNHQAEFKLVGDQRPMEVLAANTPKDLMLQFDVGTCVEVGYDPVAWIDRNPGRIRSMHCKDYSKSGKGYKVLFGEGDAPWKKIFDAAEKTGGVEFYLVEQEGSDYPPLETTEKCLAAFKKIHG